MAVLKAMDTCSIFRGGRNRTSISRSNTLGMRDSMALEPITTAPDAMPQLTIPLICWCGSFFDRVNSAPKRTKEKCVQRSAIRISSSMMFCLALAFPCCLRAEGDAAKLYKANCAVCHAADGSGNTSSGKALKAKDLRSDEGRRNRMPSLRKSLLRDRG